MRNNITRGGVQHLKVLIKRFEGLTDRPRVAVEDKALIIAVLRQEVIRRRLIQSDAKLYKRYGIDLELVEVPDYMKPKG